MPRPTNRSLALLLGLVAALLLLRLGDVPLLGPDEPRYTRVAIEMHRAGDWIRPTLQGEPWLEKPALFYWLAGLSFSVLGETEAAARLPSVLATLLMVGATTLLGARWLGRSGGLHAGFILGTSLLTFAYGRAAAMDALLAASVTLAVGLLGLGLLDPRSRWAIPAAYVFMALGTLAKGPLGFLLPGLVVAGWVLATREWRSLLRVLNPLGIALFLLVALPWYLMAYEALGQQFVDVFILDHNLRRFTSTIHNHPGPFFYYLPVLLLGTFPWSGLALPALRNLKPRESRVELFLLLWLLLPLAFFSAAGSKLPGYILPCLPPLALLMGNGAAALTRGENRRWLGAAAGVTVAIGAVAAAGPLVLRQQGEPSWVQLIPAGLWALLTTTIACRWLLRAPASGLALLRVSAAGFLVLVTLGLPPILDHRESGRRYFVEAQGREVLAWGAWRTAWMAGYFYNDARVRQVEGLPQIQAAMGQGPEGVLVLCGPGERRQLESLRALSTRVLAEGRKENVLLEIRPRR